MPRRSSLDGFFLGGEGFADTFEGSRNALFASTEFAFQISHNQDWIRSHSVVVSAPKLLMKSVGMIHGLEGLKMIGVAAGVVGSSLVLGPIATAIAVAYKMGSTVNEFINDHIETLKASDNPTISSTGRVLEGAKFGFGLGYVAPVVIIATGQLLLGNTFSGVTAASGTLMSAATFTNPVAMTCAAVGAIYFGWTALSDSERNDILNSLSDGLKVGVELIKSLVGYVCNKLKEFSSSKQLAEFKDFVKTQAAEFGKSLYDITKSVGDLVKGAAEKVSNIAGQAADSTVNATKKAADAATQAAGAVSDSASGIAKTIGEKIKGTTGSGQ